MIAAAGMWLTHQTSYQSGRLGFILLAGFVPIVSAALAYKFSHRNDMALTSGLLAVFSIYYAPFLPVPDNYDPYLILGGLYFITLSNRNNYSFLLLGGIAGLLSLARSDGLIWFCLIPIIIFSRYLSDKHLRPSAMNLLMALAGFFVIMGPWFWRTYSIYGTPLAPGGSHLLWLKTYDETFFYPANQLTFNAWFSSGWENIFSARIIALKWNFLNTFAAQGGIFLLPFILIGLWQFRKDERIRVGIFVWFSLLLVMTVVFPFAGWRGGFFHSGAALQVLWWALAPIGLESVVSFARKHNLFTPDAFRIFRVALVGIAFLMTGVILSIRVLPGWGEGEQSYPVIESFLRNDNIGINDIVMVRNPPGYFIMTGQPAIVIPYGDELSMYTVASRYNAKYVIIEKAGTAGPIKLIYDNKQSQHFLFMDEINGTRIFKVRP
jgi:hypothetical protein